MLTKEIKAKLDAIVSGGDEFSKEMVRQIYVLDEVERSTGARFDLSAYCVPKKNWGVRPSMDGIYYDPRGYRVASDSSVILATKEGYNEEYAGKSVRKDGYIMDTSEYKFPEWWLLFNELKIEEHKVESVSFERLREIEVQWKAFHRVDKKGVAGFRVGKACLRAEHAEKMRKAMEHLGTDEVFIKSERHMVWAKSERGYFGVMPVIDEEGLRKF